MLKEESPFVHHLYERAGEPDLPQPERFAKTLDSGGPMDRRLFLKLTGFAAAATALEAVPASAEMLTQAATVERAQSLPAVTSTTAPRIAVRERGTYQISGLVQLDGPEVTIVSGGMSQRISRGGGAGATAPFSTFATLDGPSLTPEITVTGGRVLSLDATPILLA
jgi:hypothetical protein